MQSRAARHWHAGSLDAFFCLFAGSSCGCQLGGAERAGAGNAMPLIDDIGHRHAVRYNPPVVPLPRRAQDIARACMSTDEPQAYAGRCQFGVQRRQHACARKIDERRSGEIAYHERVCLRGSANMSHTVART